MSPTFKYVASYLQVPVHRTLFGNSIPVDVIKRYVKVGSLWSRVGPQTDATGVLTREGEERQRQTHGENTGEDRPAGDDVHV